MKAFISFFAVIFLYYTGVSSQCAPYQFACSNGKCISRNYVCDKYDQCEDNSDEQDCEGRCAPYEFKCPSGKCIDGDSVCDLFNECGDNADEQQCDRYKCHPQSFQCLNGLCISRTSFCFFGNHCGDNSDEKYCNISSSVKCPPGWHRCAEGNRCIPSHFVCDWWFDCPEGTEEQECGSPAMIWSNYTATRVELSSEFLKKVTPGSRPWVSQLHRVAVALFFADNSIFKPGKNMGEQIRNKLATQLLRRFILEKPLTSQEFALYIQAMLVACMNPRDFYGNDLVKELRRRMGTPRNYTNPFLILTLCNAGDTMYAEDLLKVEAAYSSRHRPFWTDFEAIASMALACISSSTSGVSVDDGTLENMLQGLKRQQLKNGTVGNFRTTALVTQALLTHDSYMKGFDLDSALNVLVDGLSRSTSPLDSYYVLPVLNRKSLLNISSSHCSKQPVSEEESLQKALDITDGAMSVHYSVWMGDEKNAEKTFRLRLRPNTTLYDAVESVARVDKRHKVEYSVVNGKPYVTAFNGTKDDPEMDMFWFVCLKTLRSDEDPKIVKESPVDLKLRHNQEIILWYKHEQWSSSNQMHKSTKPL